MVNVPVFAAPPGQRPAASITRTPSLLLVWPKVPAVKVLPGLPLEDVKLALEKTSDWSATASRASTTRVRKAFFTFVPEVPLWLTRRSFQCRNRPGGGAGGPAPPPGGSVQVRGSEVDGFPIEVDGERRALEPVVAEIGATGGASVGEHHCELVGRGGAGEDSASVGGTDTVDGAVVDHRGAPHDTKLKNGGEVCGMSGSGSVAKVARGQREGDVEVAVVGERD